MSEVLDTQAKNRACTYANVFAKLSKTIFTFETDSKLVRISRVDGTLHRYTRMSQWPCIIQVCHHSLLAKYPG